MGLDSIKKVGMDYPFYEFQSHSFNMHYLVKKKIVRLQGELIQCLIKI